MCGPPVNTLSYGNDRVTRSPLYATSQLPLHVSGARVCTIVRRVIRLSSDAIIGLVGGRVQRKGKMPRLPELGQRYVTINIDRGTVTGNRVSDALSVITTTATEHYYQSRPRVPCAP